MKFMLNVPFYCYSYDKDFFLIKSLPPLQILGSF